MKILLLEDSHIDAEIIQRLLIKEISHCELKLAMSKKAFLRELDEFTPDMILSDNSLPGFNATEALKIVRDRSLHMPFILITGTVSEEYAADIIKQGADDYILKDRMARLPGAIEAAVRVRQIEREKLEAAERLKHSEENLKAIFDNSSEGFILLDENGLVKSFNKRALDSISVHTAEGIKIGKSIFDFVEPDRQDFFRNILSQVLNGEIIQYDRLYSQKDGKITWINFSFNPVREENVSKGICITGRDITEKKLSEQQREFDHNNLTALINNTRDLMWSVDRSFKLITFNQAFGDAIKLMSGVALEKGADVLMAAFNDQQLQRYKKYYERAFEGEIFTEIEYNTSPTEFWSEISFYPIYEKELVIGTACFSRDITDRKKSEEKLRQLAKEKLESKVEEQKKIARAMLIAQEKERNAIGVELHDNVNQILVGATLFLSMAKSKPENIQQLINTSLGHLQEAIRENRKIAHEFVAPDLETESMITQLKKLAGNMLEMSNIKVVFNVEQLNESLLDTERKFNIYRITQEQCTNIVKHAKATIVNFVLLTTDNNFKMTITDNGTGMDKSKKVTGIGLRNINARLGLFNGTANISTAHSEGFTLEIIIPL